MTAGASLSGRGRSCEDGDSLRQCNQGSGAGTGTHHTSRNLWSPMMSRCQIRVYHSPHLVVIEQAVYLVIVAGGCGGEGEERLRLGEGGVGGRGGGGVTWDDLLGQIAVM